MKNSLSVADKFKTLHELVAEEVRTQILRGDLPPGTRLHQSQLAEDFGVSRMPVRDALRKLEAEGLVTLCSRTGARVADVDPDEFQEIYKMRELIEPWAAGQAAQKASPDHIRVMENLILEMERATEAEDLGTWIELDRKFHMMTYQPLGMPRIQQMITELWNGTQHYRRAYCGQHPDRFREANATHRELLDAFKRGDGRRASSIERTHIIETVNRVLDELGVENRLPDAEKEVAR